MLPVFTVSSHYETAARAFVDCGDVNAPQHVLFLDSWTGSARADRPAFMMSKYRVANRLSGL